MRDSADIAALQKQAEGAAFIRIARVKEISGLSKDTLMRWIKAGDFPAPVVVTKNKAGQKEKAGTRVVSCLWDLAEVMAWRAAQFKARDERNAQKPQPEARA